MKAEFTSGDVIVLAGCTARQLQWWCERSIVKCRMEGHARRFTPSDVLRAMLIVELGRRGVSPTWIRQKLSAALDRNIAQALKDGGKLMLATDRRTLRLIEESTPIASLPESLRGILLVPISELISKIEAHEPGVKLRAVHGPRPNQACSNRRTEAGTIAPTR